MRDLESIARDALQNAAREAVESVIADEWGRGVDDVIKQAIRERALQMLHNDKPLQDKLREALMYWIRDVKDD